ncbi:hypothetical protein [Desulfopila sp. IMCC35008]|uniref:hypothetical protein n=1 Tax=Desulfopila sp. IMCC35008 TaxID=2653858 RepID=UPI0013D161DD|nr:hypothetical protein [Desulfopila sp. IMCC35008]
MTIKQLLTTLRALLHIPTWVLIFLALAAAGALLTDLYILLTLGSWTSITIDNIEYLRGTEEFATGLHDMKTSFLFSALLALIVVIVTFRTLYKRKNKPPV